MPITGSVTVIGSFTLDVDIRELHIRTGAVGSVRRQREAWIASAPKAAFSVIALAVQTESRLIAFINI